MKATVQAGLVSVDGVITAAAAARVSAFDRGFLYGDAVFEVLRTFGGVCVDLQAHAERLVLSAESMRIHGVPSTDAIVRETLRLLEARASLPVAHGESPESYVRIALTRGTVMRPALDLAVGTLPTLVIYALPLLEVPAATYAEGIALASVTTLRAAEHTSARHAKVASYVANLLAIDDARAQGAHDALLVSPSGRVTECASANVFAIFGRDLVTPSLDAGILPGITRTQVLSLGPSVGLRVTERDISRDELGKAEEVFVTSSVRGVVPVCRIDGAPVGAGRVGEAAIRVREAHELSRKARPFRT